MLFHRLDEVCKCIHELLMLSTLFFYFFIRFDQCVLYVSHIFAPHMYWRIDGKIFNKEHETKMNGRWMGKIWIDIVHQRVSIASFVVPTVLPSLFSHCRFFFPSSKSERIQYYDFFSFSLYWYYFLPFRLSLSLSLSPPFSLVFFLYIPSSFPILNCLPFIKTKVAKKQINKIKNT